MEPLELSPALLQPQDSAGAILGQLLATLPRENETLLGSAASLSRDTEEFTRELRATLYRTDGNWRYWNDTSDDINPLTFLRQALAAYDSTQGTPQEPRQWQFSTWDMAPGSLKDSWAQLAKKATKLRNTCRDLATKAADREGTNTARARELQAKAARDGTAQEHMGELGQALGREEGAKVVAGHEAQDRRIQAAVTASEATRATMERQRLEAALGLLERLVAACDGATAFPRELQRRVGDIEAALKWTNEGFFDIPEDSVAKVAEAERLWEANARLARDHLLGAVPDASNILFAIGPTSPSACGVAERCQRATEDITRLLQTPECPQSVPRESPVSVELQELRPALLQPQVTVVATLGELLATLPMLDEERLVLISPGSLYWDLEEFTNELRVTLCRIDDSWWHHNDDGPHTSNDAGPVSSLSQALDAYNNNPWTTWDDVTMAASEWHRSVSALVNSWTKLARAATELRNTCRNLATKAADREASNTAQTRELQAEAARDGTAQEHMGELGQALGREEGAEVVAGREAQDRRIRAAVTASEATRATMERQRLEAALGLLERLVAACDGATAFPRKLKRRVGDIEAALKWRKKGFFDIPEDLMAKVAEAERLWEANARLAKDHLLGTLGDIIGFYFDHGPTSARGVAERCQRATEDIPRLLQVPECPQSIPKISPVSLEPQELSPALLQPQVTVVATLGELLATLPRRGKEMLLPESTVSLYRDLVTFTESLRVTLYCTEGTWWHRNVTSDGGDPVPSLSQALDACRSTPGTTWDDVTMAARKWRRSVAVLVNSWTKLAKKATKLRRNCRDLATEVADREGTNTARARELQAEAARDGTAQEHMGELGQALGREEGAEVVAGYEAWVSREARVAASEATRATMERQRLEAALGLLERLVAACDGATAFPRELQRRAGDIDAALKWRNEESPNVPEDSVAKVAEAERLWEANARLAKDPLLGAVPDASNILFAVGPTSPSACGVAERCQRATEDSPRLLQPPESPQSVPRESPVSLELQELSPALLQPQDSAGAILGQLLATLPRENETLLGSAASLSRDTEEFTRELRATLYRTDGNWRYWNDTSDDINPLTFLRQALAAYDSTQGTPQEPRQWQFSTWDMAPGSLKDSWAQLAKKATKLRNTCRDLATEAADREATATARARELQAEAARDGTAQEHMGELGQALGREEGAEVVAGHEAQVRREAGVAASEATRATMERQRLEAALGLLERLVAACDGATAFNRELQRRVGDIAGTSEGTNEESPNVPEDSVAKVAEAEWLWDPSFWLGSYHPLGAVPDASKLCFTGGPTSPSACGVAEQCQRATEQQQRAMFWLSPPPACPQSVPRESPVSLEPQELSPALLQPQVTVVATLGELLATLPRRGKEMLLPESTVSLYRDLVTFTESLRVTLYCTEGTWWRRNVTSDGGDPVPSPSRALAACRSTPGTTCDDVTMAARKWDPSVPVLGNSWTKLARAATELPHTCRDLAAEAANMEATATARARELQAKAARDGTAQEHMGELGQALGREEGAEVVAGHEAQVRREARVAASEATRATMERQRLEAALVLLELSVAPCDGATAFPRELQRRAGDIESALKWRNEGDFDIPEALVAKVAEAERLSEANARLAKDPLLGAVPDASNILFAIGPTSPSACGVAERCQRATEDSPRLLQTPESPQSVPRESPVSLELQEVSPPQLLEALVSMVATLGEVTATVTGPRRGVRRCVPPKLLHAALRIFTWSLRKALDHPADPSHGPRDVPSLGQALAALGATPGATWAGVRAAGSAWRELVATREERWKQLLEEVTKLRDACEDAALAWARHQQDKATRRGTAGDNLAAPAQQLMVAPDRDEEASAGAAHGARVAVATNKAVGEAVVATRPARAAIRRRHWAEVALEPLQRLVAACDKATEFISYMDCQLRAIEAALEGTKEASPDVPETLVAVVAKFEQLWEASARLFKHHLLGTLGDIHDLLLSPYDGRGGPDGSGSHAVAERCQKAIEAIPRLLQDSDVTAATSSRQ
ncbi:uncharacterized protein [Agelaius tricolor]|uniref:uncharacterized protein n=1 Tax=Agelaius tricolor TaxID=9191 RepID=UPI0039F2639A